VTDFRMQLGHALKQQRQRRKLSQIKLAELAEVSDRYIADVEAGKANLTMKVLDRLAAALDWDPLAELTVDSDPRAGHAAREVLAKLTELGESLESTIDRLKALHAQFLHGDGPQPEPSAPPIRRSAPRRRSTKKSKSTAKIH